MPREPRPQRTRRAIDFEDMSADEGGSWEHESWARVPDSVRRMYIDVLWRTIVRGGAPRGPVN